MPEDSKSSAGLPVEPAKLETPNSEQENETEIGDFIARHVLEKDSVFFEG